MHNKNKHTCQHMRTTILNRTPLSRTAQKINGVVIHVLYGLMDRKDRSKWYHCDGLFLGLTVPGAAP